MRFFPAYTFQSVLLMRARQFFALNAQIGTLAREEEAHALSIHHNSKPDVRLREIISELNAQRKDMPRKSSLGLIAAGEAHPVASGELQAELERQKANWEEMKRDREGWMARKMQERFAKENSGDSSKSE
jgi:hypothetical protein